MEDRALKFTMRKQTTPNETKIVRLAMLYLFYPNISKKKLRREVSVEEIKNNRMLNVGTC